MISSKKAVVILCAGLFLLGIVISNVWFGFHNPMKPLYVEVVNGTDTLIPTVVVEHGGMGLQEKVIIVRLKPGQRRLITLNHKPGLGFNVLVNFADGSKTEICGGKSKGYWFFRETITKFGIYTTPLR